MQLLNLLKAYSKLKITQKNPILFFKQILNKLARLRLMAESRSRAVKFVPKGRIELLNSLNMNKIGGLIG